MHKFKVGDVVWYKGHYFAAIVEEGEITELLQDGVYKMNWKHVKDGKLIIASVTVEERLLRLRYPEKEESKNDKKGVLHV